MKIQLHHLTSKKKKRQLHLHIISQDFDSPHLKTKKHWNSFTTPYFVSHETIVNMLKNDEKIKV